MNKRIKKKLKNRHGYMTYKEYKMRKYYLDQIPDLNDVMTKIWDKFNLFHKLGKSLDQVANGLKPEITKTELKSLYNYCKKDRLYKYCKRG